MVLVSVATLVQSWSLWTPEICIIMSRVNTPVIIIVSWSKSWVLNNFTSMTHSGVHMSPVMEPVDMAPLTPEICIIMCRVNTHQSSSYIKPVHLILFVVDKDDDGMAP